MFKLREALRSQSVIQENARPEDVVWTWCKIITSEISLHTCLEPATADALTSRKSAHMHCAEEDPDVVSGDDIDEENDEYDTDDFIDMNFNPHV